MGYREANISDEVNKLLIACPLCKKKPVCEDVSHDCARMPDYTFRCWTDNCPLYWWPDDTGYGVHTIEMAAGYWNQSLKELCKAFYDVIKALEDEEEIYYRGG